MSSRKIAFLGLPVADTPIIALANTAPAPIESSSNR
jgi:hypothetical protein